MRKALLALGAAITVTIGGVTVVVDQTTPRGCGAKCCKRPTGAEVTSCLRKNPNDHSPNIISPPEDFGDENTMPAALAIGAGCVPTECLVGRGIELLP